MPDTTATPDPRDALAMAGDDRCATCGRVPGDPGDLPERGPIPRLPPSVPGSGDQWTPEEHAEARAYRDRLRAVLRDGRCWARAGYGCGAPPIDWRALYRRDVTALLPPPLPEDVAGLVREAEVALQGVTSLDSCGEPELLYYDDSHEPTTAARLLASHGKRDLVRREVARLQCERDTARTLLPRLLTALRASEGARLEAESRAVEAEGLLAVTRRREAVTRLGQEARRDGRRKSWRLYSHDYSLRVSRVVGAALITRPDRTSRFTSWEAAMDFAADALEAAGYATQNKENSNG